MQVKLELRNLHGDERAALLEASQGAEIEIRISAREVAVDCVGRSAIVRCGDARLSWVSSEAGQGAWAGPALDEPRSLRRMPSGGIYADLGDASPPRRFADGSAHLDAARLPPPILPAWVEEIGDSGARLRPRSLYDSADERDLGGRRFGPRPDGWDR